MGEEGRNVPPSFVYDTARYDLLQRAGLNSYAIGFGNDVGFGEKMKKVVTGSGGYYNAKSSNDLQSTFNEIAKSMLASAKNVLLKTNPGYYSGYYKYFRFKFTAEGGYTDVIYAQMDGTPTTGYTLAISKIENGYAYFDAPAKGVVDDETGKVHIPLNNLKFVKDGKELQYSFWIEVSFDGELYYEDVEEASTEEEIGKRIAVVLVLDCSTSMGDAFKPMKDAAVYFIDMMKRMVPNIETDTREYVDLGLSVKWATCNIGATKPEDYGNYFAWGETKPKYYFDMNNYKWYDGTFVGENPCVFVEETYPNIIKYTHGGATSLEKTDDVAAVIWKGNWRMPSPQEIAELCDNCIWSWTTSDGVNGYKVTSKKNGNSIFLPAAGWFYHGELQNAGKMGEYWSNTVDSTLDMSSYDCYSFQSAKTIFFTSEYYRSSEGARENGYPVRPVCQ